MAQVELSSNYDRAARREWLAYEFWTPAAFGLNHDLSERTVRHLIALGMPAHGRPHKGTGGLRLCKSAGLWLEQYRRMTRLGNFRFQGMTADFLDDLECHVADERQAFARLYGEPIPRDEYLEGPEGGPERRSWKTKFREVKRAGSVKP